MLQTIKQAGGMFGSQSLPIRDFVFGIKVDTGGSNGESSLSALKAPRLIAVGDAGGFGTAEPTV